MLRRTCRLMPRMAPPEAGSLASRAMRPGPCWKEAVKRLGLFLSTIRIRTPTGDDGAVRSLHGEDQLPVEELGSPNLAARQSVRQSDAAVFVAVGEE